MTSHDIHLLLLQRLFVMQLLLALDFLSRKGTIQKNFTRKEVK